MFEAARGRPARGDPAARVVARRSRSAAGAGPLPLPPARCCRSPQESDVARVHQVLATLGYGDAIGNEVLGVQRVLRSAGYESDIFVETADRRFDDCTIDYREMVGAIGPDDVLIHHFSIGSRASRTAYALPGRMVLVYHNITPRSTRRRPQRARRCAEDGASRSYIMVGPAHSEYTARS
jgi:hypothetical protein